jgi:branched-chain amino acid transport system substrate-binding protein
MLQALFSNAMGKRGLVLVLLVTAFALACSESAQDRSEPLSLRLGVVQSASGAAAIYGKSVNNGVELAIKQLETDALQIDYTLVDDGSTVEGGRTAFTTLQNQGVDAIIGPTLSNVGLESLKISQQAAIPTIGATLTAEGITAIGDQVFRTALAENEVVPPVLEYVSRVHGMKDAVLILDGQDAFSRSFAAAMRRGMQAVGGSIRLEIDVSAQGDVPGALAQLHDDPVDAFLVTPLVNQSAAIVQAIRAAGFEQLIVGGNSFNTLDLVAASANAVDGAFVGASWNPGVSSERSKDFVEDYTRAYGAPPDLYAAQGYVAVEVLVAAVRSAGSVDRAAIQSALAATKDLETVFGKISISEAREAQYSPVIQQFQDGKLVVIQN